MLHLTLIIIALCLIAIGEVWYKYRLFEIGVVMMIGVVLHIASTLPVQIPVN